MIAPLHSYWNEGIDLIHIDLRTLEEKIDSIHRQIKFKRRGGQNGRSFRYEWANSRGL